MTSVTLTQKQRFEPQNVPFGVIEFLHIYCSNYVKDVSTITASICIQTLIYTIDLIIYSDWEY